MSYLWNACSNSTGPRRGRASPGLRTRTVPSLGRMSITLPVPSASRLPPQAHKQVLPVLPSAPNSPTCARQNDLPSSSAPLSRHAVHVTRPFLTVPRPHIPPTRTSTASTCQGSPPFCMHMRRPQAALWLPGYICVRRRTVRTMC